jgi:hypothetical protein
VNRKAKVTYSFVDFSEANGLLLATKSNPKRFAQISETFLSIGSSPDNLVAQATQGSWINGETWNDLQTKLCVSLRLKLLLFVLKFDK